MRGAGQRSIAETLDTKSELLKLLEVVELGTVKRQRLKNAPPAIWL